MTFSLGINGFGRIGRGVLRAAIDRGDVNIVAINDLIPPEQNAYLLKYDSVHGRCKVPVSFDNNSISVNGRKIAVVAERDPAQIKWKSLGVDIVLECTGLFTNREKAELHFKGGAKKVLISAPAQGEDLTVAMGINHEFYNNAKHQVISNASCTTNCLAPVAKVLHDNFQIRHGLMTTIHSYTNDQRILDVAHSDLRRARAAAMSQIPTTTGAARAIGLVIPDLKGKLDGMAIRVPTSNVSCVDLVCEVVKPASKELINAALKQASATSLKGILDYTEDAVVSSDFNGNPASSTVDSLCTSVVDSHLVKVLAWYDNETGFSHRLLDLAKYVGERL